MFAVVYITLSKPLDCRARGSVFLFVGFYLSDRFIKNREKLIAGAKSMKLKTTEDPDK